MEPRFEIKKEFESHIDKDIDDMMKLVKSALISDVTIFNRKDILKKE